MSNVPLVVKLSVFATESVLMAAGVRDVLIPGTPLPLPGDDKLMLLWSSAMKRKQRIAAPVPPPQAFLAAMLGAFVLLSAAAKLAATFSHFEGTFLRRNLFLVFGCADLAIAALMHHHSAVVLEFTGAGLDNFVLLLMIEGVAFLLDAIFRPRKAKSA
ncbi:hypothetical protein EMIHUDRAFT_462868 [Emiliania huxleyi CCMP1516]|uniref:Uncharacterized protein n=2 Tax=Emiliania huxleyi TaxID=2903 RepID=A0A0D3K5Z6_EMIH1|nr:hypothetical protein EMIHUDRAFT_446156 [Emiliania huxleyi CCMP1516]XP_005783610.1 hypothetical protein EMIHUDRAFT_462868 [Emiliania huxleyi CCMP1516]EOD10979.1 hypothetical protein EMIHUDRAFT_446156 [Emiliania huxleyi CCMP1516]EOD31181.1 hypothetical protein EMIHUDRAFT_462868 [Emiliania huxleyi CCMP1516]|eukprot:XP_005763408.1 hypothetical protein EMIHUDRAFT_446156 [Emiliania huxleyi CCMP1516]